KLEMEAKKKEESLHRVLNQPLTFVQKAVVDVGSAIYFDVLGKKPKIDEDAARLAREKFGEYFPETVEEMLRDLLNDPEGYSRKVEEYENLCPPVSVDFPTNPAHYRLITRDPSRQIQEILTELALLSNFPPRDGKYYAIDVGTGYGRLARVMEDTLRSLYGEKRDYKVFGMDIFETNIEEAKELNEETGSEIIFFTRDMNTIPFPPDTFNLVNTTDASYLNFRHRRPFYIAEIARVLNPDDGRGCITNPNENTTLKEYNYVMMRTNYRTYLNPLNILRSTVLGKCSINIDGLAKARPDWALTTTRDMTNTLRKILKADIIDISNWPRAGGPPIYSGFTFAVNDRTKEELRRYTKFREGRREAEGWINIEGS
ncbi:MAG: methyltransferase domain-containing protein, partial [Thermodesulfobacteriota bacterium]|nr:methyltransferase domain-containing protein [Thermodesulfobacteriota bacterium]